MAAVRQLKLDQEEQAFWLSCTSITSLLIGPVYKYNKVTRKIFEFFQGIFDCISYVFYLVIVNPLSKLYHGIKYIVLLKWIPGKYFLLIQLN